MSERRIFTHPSVRQSGDYYDQYTETAARLVCRTCGSPWADHNGWSCDGHSVTVLPDAPAVAHKCALCSVLFTADADKQFIAAHAKVCEKRPLAVGDYMRLDCSRDGSDWVEGPIVTLRGTDGHAAISPERASVRMSHRIHGNPFTFAVVASLGIRRIPRPAAEVRAVLNERDGAMYYGDIRLTDGKPPTIETPWISTTKCLPLDPLDTKYDGVTLRTLIDGDAFNRQEQGGAMWRAKPMTPVQRAAVSAHWSAELRAKLAASKERERLQVVVDDGEVGPWW